jgi:hypothetical protein
MTRNDVIGTWDIEVNGTIGTLTIKDGVPNNDNDVFPGISFTYNGIDFWAFDGHAHFEPNSVTYTHVTGITKDGFWDGTLWVGDYNAIGLQHHDTGEYLNITLTNKH